MSEPLPIVADLPAIAPGFGFQAHVEALAAAIRGGEPAQFTVGLYGPWGSGKSSLLNGLHGVLEKDALTIPVLFDAWRHERVEHIAVPMLNAIRDVVAETGRRAPAQQLQRALTALLRSLKITLPGVSVDFAAIEEGWEAADGASLNGAFDEPYREMQKLPALLEGGRVVVLIDDLDRCSPHCVVDVLEAINLVMDVPGFVFVIALDYDALIQAVAVKYPNVSGDRFIEKMVQLPFRVPPIAFDSTHALAELLPRLTIGRDFATFVLDVAHSALDGNPRQVKRLLNTYLVLSRIRGDTSAQEEELLLALVGFQLRWPHEYRDLQAAALGNQADAWLNEISTSEPASELAKFVKHVLRPRAADLHLLRQALRLTANVGGPGVDQAEATAPIAAQHAPRTQLLLDLVAFGFVERRGSAKLRASGVQRLERNRGHEVQRVEIDATAAYVSRRVRSTSKPMKLGEWGEPTPFYIDTDGIAALWEYTRSLP